MNESRYGILREKFDRSGILGQPTISDQELNELLLILKELKKVMIDISCRPIAHYFSLECDMVENVLELRRRESKNS
jgi:hypothetical protein